MKAKYGRNVDKITAAGPKEMQQNDNQSPETAEKEFQIHYASLFAL